MTACRCSGPRKTNRTVLKTDAAIPLDLEAALTDDGWRDGFAWPMAPETARDLDLRPRERFLQTIEAHSDPLIRDILLHAAPHLWMNGLGLLEQALLIEAADRLNRPLRGGPPEAYRLRGLPLPAELDHTESIDLVPTRIPNALARRVRRTLSWTPPHRLPRALLAPEAVAVTHNSLLVAEAGRDGRAIGFRHADNYLDGWTETRVPGAVRDALVDALPDLARLYTEGTTVDPGLFAEEFSRMMTGALDRSARSMLCLRSKRKMPGAVLSGTGGFFPSRAIKIETRRRGGIAWGYDHGGTAGFVEEPFASALLELSVSDRFTLPTTGLADAVRECSGPFPALFGGCEIAGGDGDPGFASRTVSPKPHQPSARPKTLFVTGPFVGPRQRAQPRIHDVVKFDWHLRCAETMNAMPIDLLCQPHPEGVLKGRPHPITRIAPASGMRFEDVAAWADVIVTDMVFSTTLWKAACLPVPIVLLDLDMGGFNATMRPLLEQRFRRLKIRYDADNRPTLDGDALEPLLRRPLNPEEADAAQACRAFLAGGRG